MNNITAFEIHFGTNQRFWNPILLNVELYFFLVIAVVTQGSKFPVVRVLLTARPHNKWTKPLLIQERFLAAFIPIRTQFTSCL